MQHLHARLQRLHRLQRCLAPKHIGAYVCIMHYSHLIHSRCLRLENLCNLCTSALVCGDYDNSDTQTCRSEEQMRVTMLPLV